MKTRPRRPRPIHSKELKRQINIVRAIIKLDSRLKKIEKKDRVVAGFSTDCIGQEAPIVGDDDWPDEEFFWVENKQRKGQFK